MNILYRYAGNTQSTPYKQVLAAKKTHNYRFACHMARELADIVPFSRNSIAILPQGILTPHMAQCLPVKAIVLPRIGGMRHVNSPSREQRYKINPFYLPCSYKSLISKASHLIIIDDLSVSGATLWHVSNILKHTGKPIYTAVWLRVMG